jgi:hypothetical protein
MSSYYSLLIFYTRLAPYSVQSMHTIRDKSLYTFTDIDICYWHWNLPAAAIRRLSSSRKVIGNFNSLLLATVVEQYLNDNSIFLPLWVWVGKTGVTAWIHHWPPLVAITQAHSTAPRSTVRSIMDSVKFTCI